MDGTGFETGKHYKLHHSYIWLGSISSAFVLIFVLVTYSGPVAFELISGIQQTRMANAFVLFAIAAALLAAPYLVMVGIHSILYRYASYVFDEREFSYYSGFITKKKIHIPYARVQSVNHRATIVQRIAGVCTVTIDSAGGSQNKALKIPYVTLRDAERIRLELFTRKSMATAESQFSTASYAAANAGAPTCSPHQSGAQPNTLDDVAGSVGTWRGAYGGGIVGMEHVSCEFGLSNKELAFTSVSHDTPIGIALFLGISCAIALGIVFAIEKTAALFIGAIIVPAMLTLMLISWLIGIASIAISYGGFRARRRGSRIETERGLLQREFSGIDVARVQSIEIRQTFVRKLLGYCEISVGRIDAADQESNSNKGSLSNGLVVHPFAKVSDVDTILNGLIPEFADRPRVSQCSGLPRVATRRAILRRCVWYNWWLWTAVAIAVCILLFASTAAAAGDVSSQKLLRDAAPAISGIFGMIASIVAIATIVRAVSAVKWSKESGYAWTRDYALLHNSGLSSEITVVPRRKIQCAQTRSNPFQRRLSLATILITTAAGTGSTTNGLLDVPQESADAWLTWLQPRR